LPVVRRSEHRRPGFTAGCRAAALAAVLALASQLTAPASSRRFFDDDPIAVAPETQDASGAQAWEIDLGYDLLYNLFVRPVDRSYNGRALNVSTIDEVPDSSWFTNRILARPLTIQDALRGPNTGTGPADGTLHIIGAKSAGVAPGFTVRDSRGDVWFLSFDAAGHPEAATGAIAVASKIFWALGYNQIESYLLRITTDQLVIAADAELTPPSGNRRAMRRDDVRRVLRRAHQSGDGAFRAIAGRAVVGKPLGGFRYYGTRPDDPNDVVRHEHRRELRALKVFGAWTNLVDMKAGNTLDTLVTENGRGIVRHYLQDVGSTFGTGALGPREWDEGYEYLYEGDKVWKRAVTFGFYLGPWQRVPYEDVPAIGRFEGEQFDPLLWRPRVPVAAIEHARADDTFWAARRVAAFSDEMIRALTTVGEYSDPASADHLARVLIQRRDAIARVYLTRINPFVEFALDAAGRFSFANAAQQTGAETRHVSEYRVRWYRFDNNTGASTWGGEVTTDQPSAVLSEIGRTPTEFLKVAVAAAAAPHESWTKPVDVYFRRSGGGWTLVGVERLP
jgi:hypothetical protein